MLEEAAAVGGEAGEADFKERDAEDDRVGEEAAELGVGPAGCERRRGAADKEKMSRRGLRTEAGMNERSVRRGMNATQPMAKLTKETTMACAKKM